MGWETPFGGKEDLYDEAIDCYKFFFIYKKPKKLDRKIYLEFLSKQFRYRFSHSQQICPRVSYNRLFIQIDGVPQSMNIPLSLPEIRNQGIQEKMYKAERINGYGVYAIWIFIKSLSRDYLREYSPCALNLAIAFDVYWVLSVRQKNHVHSLQFDREFVPIVSFEFFAEHFESFWNTFARLAEQKI